MNKQPITLAIDTSCDETSVSVVRGFTVLSNIQPSQMKYHKKYGGVVPSLARFAHEERIDNVVEIAMKRAGVDFDEIDAVAVTKGPGLAIALEVGIKKAKELAKSHKKPLIVVNHMEGHLLSALAERNTTVRTEYYSVPTIDMSFPVLGFLISGGHTELVLVKDFCEYEVIGKKLDDSCGEAYDKCGRIIGLGYPAGPSISNFAKQHRKNIKFSIEKHNQSTKVVAENMNTGKIYKLPVAMLNSGDLNFSYSGLKTAFKELAEDLAGDKITVQDQLEGNIKELKKQEMLDLIVLFEKTALIQLTEKLKKAIEIHNPTEIWLGGGVVASAKLRSEIRKTAKEFGLSIKFPYSKKLMTDNAAMIGVASNVRINKFGLSHNPAEGIFTHEFEKIDREAKLKLQ